MDPLKGKKSRCRAAASDLERRVRDKTASGKQAVASCKANAQRVEAIEEELDNIDDEWRRVEVRQRQREAQQANLEEAVASYRAQVDDEEENGESRDADEQVRRKMDENDAMEASKYGKYPMELPLAYEQDVPCSTFLYYRHAGDCEEGSSRRGGQEEADRAEPEEDDRDREQDRPGQGEAQEHGQWHSNNQVRAHLGNRRSSDVRSMPS